MAPTSLAHKIAAGAVGAAVANEVLQRVLNAAWALDPKGRVVVITGCDTGFGRLATERLAKLGAVPVAGCYTEKGLQDLQRAVPSAVVLPLDVTQQASVDAFAAEVRQRFPNGVHALINNAGINVNSIIEIASMEDFDRTFSVNVYGVFRVTKALLSSVRKAQGRVINIASMAGTVALPGQAAYAASKHAVVGFTDCLRREMHPFGVKVVSIEPVIMRTPIVDDWLASRSLRRDWQEAPDEIKRAYGPGFEAAFMNATAEFVHSDTQDPELVILALLAALFDGLPKVRYQVGIPLIIKLVPSIVRTSLGDTVLRQKFPMPVARL